MDKEKFLELINKQTQGKTTPQEDDVIFKFYDQLQESDTGKEINSIERTHIQKKIKKNIDKQIARNPNIRLIDFLSYGRVAATLALLVSFTFMVFYYLTKPEAVELISRSTNQHQKATITLSDGTRVYLNSQSKIRFPKKFAHDNRMVELEGEAFFEVVSDHDRPFTVISNGAITKVLGTSFNINASSGEDVIVAVRTGKVEVSDLEDLSKTVKLHPNQKATFLLDSKELFIGEADLDYYLEWRNKKISFNLISLDEVMERVAKVYNIQIILKGYHGEDCLIRAMYPNNNLYSILYGLHNLVEFEYEWLDDKILEINYKGCKK